MNGLVKVTKVRVLGDTMLDVTFSDHRSGVQDFSLMLAESGPMVEPLRDPSFFRRVFIQSGVLTWPNGFDVDAIRLHDEMLAAGLLRPGKTSLGWVGAK